MNIRFRMLAFRGALTPLGIPPAWSHLSATLFVVSHPLFLSKGIIPKPTLYFKKQLTNVKEKRTLSIKNNHKNEQKDQDITP